jgi:hypothetical protein
MIEKYVPPTRWHSRITLQGIITQNSTIRILTGVKPLNLILPSIKQHDGQNAHRTFACLASLPDYITRLCYYHK